MQVSEQFAKVVRRTILAMIVIVFALALYSHSQNGGTIGIQAQMIPVFSGQTSSAASGGIWACGVTSGSCPYFQDIGQGTNLLFYCNTNFTGNVYLEWTPNPNVASPTFYTITQAIWAGDSNCHYLPFGSYFPNVRAHVLTSSPSSISAWYTAISGPVSFAAPALATNGPTSPVTCDRVANISIANSTTAVLIQPAALGDTVVVCGIQVSFAAATSTGTFTSAFFSTTACSTGEGVPIVNNTTSSTPQFLNLPFYGLRSPVSTSQVFCFSNASGASVYVTTLYASVHGL